MAPLTGGVGCALEVSKQFPKREVYDDRPAVHRFRAKQAVPLPRYIQDLPKQYLGFHQHVEMARAKSCRMISSSEIMLWSVAHAASRR